MTSKKRRRPSNKGNDSVGVISTLHWVGWLLLGTGLMFATQEDFLPNDTTSELAAMAAVVMGILYLATQGVQLFKFVQQQWAWCNEVIAGIAVLFGATLFACCAGWRWPMSYRPSMPGAPARRLTPRLKPGWSMVTRAIHADRVWSGRCWKPGCLRTFACHKSCTTRRASSSPSMVCKPIGAFWCCG